MTISTYTLAAYNAAKATLLTTDTVTVSDSTLTAAQIATLGADTLVDTIQMGGGG